jgi:hypothetical protein
MKVVVICPTGEYNEHSLGLTITKQETNGYYHHTNTYYIVNRGTCKGHINGGKYKSFVNVVKQEAEAIRMDK